MTQQATIDQSTETDEQHRRQADAPDIPVGNAPPGPSWPLILSGLLWLAWVVFLFVMVLSTRASATL